ncbi:MAG: [FeFe] hydrogenase H-cluster maturation GTPase HydF [Bacteroidales bacterium]|nr:[FeFe] hydrogenase H-cluster maturation GTPase HydF [Bacteroidales bacterium]
MKGSELKPHIGLFGRRNYGKSSLVNYLTGQTVSIVSAEAGTTTDPVKKTMEISGIGPVVWIDTAGVDDDGYLGTMRVEKTLRVLPEVDLALILFTNNLFDIDEIRLVDACQSAGKPFLLVYTQSDRFKPEQHIIDFLTAKYGAEHLFVVSIYDQRLRTPLCDRIKSLLPESSYVRKSTLAGLIGQGDNVVMVTPIDSSAPEGRMILPQVQVLRDILDLNAKAFVTQPDELQSLLSDLKNPPALVVTDSQAFAAVSAIVPVEVPLTSFSILLARNKGLFKEYLEGTTTISRLRDGDRVLLLESCTHNVTCEDIGRVKLPALLRKFTGKQLTCDIVAGASPLPENLNDYSLVIQCGGCVVTHQQLVARLMPAVQASVPVSNYGLALAYLNGIFDRATQIFNKK